MQRVLVDGWSPQQAAADFGLRERHVSRCVAAFRRFGMASLRGDAAADGALRRWLRQVKTTVAQLFAVLPDEYQPRPARCIVLRRDSAQRGGNPNPRSLWN